MLRTANFDIVISPFRLWMRPIGVIKSYQLPLAFKPSLFDCPLIYEPVRLRSDWCVGGQTICSTAHSNSNLRSEEMFTNHLLRLWWPFQSVLESHEDLFGPRDREISFNFSHFDLKCRRSSFKGRLGTLSDGRVDIFFLTFQFLI